jgi:hypothetical protein
MLPGPCGFTRGRTGFPGPYGFTRAMRAFNHSRADGEGSRDKMLLAVSAQRPRLIHILSKDHNHAKNNFHNCPQPAPGHVTALNTLKANFSTTVPSTRSGPRRHARYTLNYVRNHAFNHIIKNAFNTILGFCFNHATTPQSRFQPRICALRCARNFGTYSPRSSLSRAVPPLYRLSRYGFLVTVATCEVWPAGEGGARDRSL